MPTITSAWGLRIAKAPPVTSAVRCKLRLYISGDAPNSILARRNLAVICKEHLSNECDVEIIDMLRDPQRGLEDSIRMTPTLVKWEPAPVKRIVGTLSEPDKVLLVLGLAGRV